MTAQPGKAWASVGAVVLAIVTGVFAIEGGYTNNPADPGGETNHGVTVAVARKHGYDGPMRELPKETAQQIYVGSYVEGPGFHRVVALSPAVGEKLVDAGVNAGTGRSARWFQQALNHLSRGGADFPLVAVDGQIGAQTLAAYRALERKRGRTKACELVLKLLDAQQGTHYMSLNKPTFIVGWADHRLGNVPLERCADRVAAQRSTLAQAGDGAL
jgi:lysozyme family protein